ncbi:DegT/DnrJ/EryC1/StrS family aminotransferase [Neisseria sp. Ec49-e6-T10]|uniref:DegT/DnrJ/EryC1/StrS family aminotransferase n=1 Tax=Neisseria sp. Ec49-e6-T10 TaxID=3140744 RepID=UPI003EB85FF1
MAFQREIPPTAGLPPFLTDLISFDKGSLVDRASLYFNLPFFQLECSGTAAFIIILMALKKLEPNRKEVIIPAYTCPLMVLAIKKCNLQIKICDLAYENIDFDFDHLANLVNEHTLAIVPTHLGGRVVDVAKAKNIAQQHGAFVIEDAAQALGADVGQIADVSFFSLAVGKGLSIFEGGLISSHNTSLQHHIKQTSAQLSHFNLGWELRRTVEFIGYSFCYRPQILSFVYGHPRRKALKKQNLIEAVGDFFDEIPIHKVGKFRQNAGFHALTRLPQYLNDTNKQAMVRLDRLSKIKEVKVIQDQNQQGIWPFFMVLVPVEQIRNHILDELWSTPLGVSRLFIHALPDYLYLQELVPSTPVSNARDLANRMFTISNSLWLTDDLFEKICQTIENIMNESKIYFVNADNNR